MTFRKAADGITKQGKTKGRNLGDSGPIAGIQTGPDNRSGGGKLNTDMKKMGRGMAKVANQKRHAGRGR
jgi:hypothetical protein